jgi:hypothetical protein
MYAGQAYTCTPVVLSGLPMVYAVNRVLWLRHLCAAPGYVTRNPVLAGTNVRGPAHASIVSKRSTVMRGSSQQCPHPYARVPKASPEHAREVEVHVQVTVPLAASSRDPSSCGRSAVGLWTIHDSPACRQSVNMVPSVDTYSRYAAPTGVAGTLTVGEGVTLLRRAAG